jgi:hypothetical protein
MILVASVLYNVPQENQEVDQLLPLSCGTLYKTDATSIMLDYLLGDLGEPKGEEVGVADLLPGFLILVASVLYNVPQENQEVDQLLPLLHPLVHLNLQVGNLT